MNFNVNFNVLLNKYIVHPLVKQKDFDNIKMRGTNMKGKKRFPYVYGVFHFLPGMVKGQETVYKKSS